MRIAYLSSSLIPSRAANSVHVMKMCQTFAALGNRVTLYARAGDATSRRQHGCRSPWITLYARQGDPTGIEVDDFARYGVERCFRIVKCSRSRFQKLTGDLLYAREVASQVARRPQPDLFFARHIYSLARVAHSGAPMLFEAHTPPVNILQKWVEAAVYRRGNFSRLVVISRALAREYRRLFPWLTEDKILVAPDAADPPGSVRSQPTSVNPPLVEWTARSGCLQAGYVGHLYAGRGIELIAALARRLPEIDFHLVGGMEKDIARCKQTCSATNVHFHGYLPHVALSAVYERFDVLLAPYQNRVVGVGGKKEFSRWMSPLKIFEYMAAGKAIVCSDLPVLREVLTDRVNAWLIPPQDISAWVEALRTLQADADLRLSLGRAAQRDFLTRHTWNKRAEFILGSVTRIVYHEEHEGH